MPDLVGHRGEQVVALLLGEVAVAHDAVEQDLDVHLVVGGVHAGGVVDEVGVDPSPEPPQPCSAYSMRPRWVRPRLPPSPTDRRAQLRRRSTRIASLALSPASALRLLLGLHVGADAAVPQQVDVGQQDAAHQLVRRHRGDAVGEADSASRTSSVIEIDFACRENTPPPAEITSRS